MNRAPEQIGPYRLEGLLGRGGVGAVHRARHVQSGWLVALKTLETTAASFPSTLRREVAALARLRHPGIVRVLDSGLHQGLPWVAMELVEGPTLRQHAVSAEPRPILSPGRLQAILTLVRRICSPLAYLHGEGIVHRDLKPDNILIRAVSGQRPAVSGEHRDGSSLSAAGWPVLVDFGLVSEFSSPLSRETLAVDTGAAGTLRYMAPEQIQGRLLDARADLYALGCILYEMLSGQPPFHGATQAELVKAHLHGIPTRPSALVEGLPVEIDELVLRLLEKEPRRRLGHADDVAATLAALGAENGSEGPAARPYLYRPELAGREEVLRELETRLEPLQASLQPQQSRDPRRATPPEPGSVATRAGLVLLGGESGVGKSRLTLELGRSAEQRGWRVLTGECLPALAGVEQTAAGIERVEPSDPATGSPRLAATGGPLHPLRKALQAVADRCRSFGPEETERLLGRRGKLLAFYEPALSGLPGQEAYPEPAELPAEAARLRLFNFLTETFVALAQEAAILLLLDDLQWADELTLGWLEYHLRSASTGTRGDLLILVLGTYRIEEDSALRQLLQTPGALRLRLGRLEESGVHRMVSDMLALEPPPSIFVRFLHRHSEGNPFFVAEYLRGAIAEGLLFRSEGLWQVAKGPREAAAESLYEELPLPRSLRETVERRLGTLSAEAQQLAAAAAVIGREMDEALLLGVIQAELEQGLAALEELRAREILEASATSRFRFAHDKLREVAYERIGAEARRSLHRAAAEAIEAGQSAAPVHVRDERLAVLGHHWEQAGAADKARNCYLAAARVAKDRYAFNDAHELYQAYRRLVDRETTESIEAGNEAAYEVLYPQGRMHEARVLLEQALAAARQSGDSRLEATLLGNLGWLHNEEGEFEAAQALYEQGLAVTRQTGDGLGEGTALNRLGVLRKNQGRVQEAREFYEQAIAVAVDIGDLRLEEVTLGNLGWLQGQLGEMDEAWALYERGLAIARQTGNKPDEGMMLSRMGVLRSFLGQLEESWALQEQALDIQREIGNPRNVGRSLGNLGVMSYDQGEMEKAEALFEQALAVHRQSNDPLAEALTLGHQGLVRAAQGRPDEARALYEEALAVARQSGDRPGEGSALGYLGSLLGEEGLVDEALHLFSEALGIHRQAGNHRMEGWVLAELARLRRRTSVQPDEALALAQTSAGILLSGGRDLRALPLAEQGHARLAAGGSAASEHQEVRALSDELGRTGTASECGRALARLERAQVAFEAGQPLFRGECWEDLPEGLRRWLIRTGQAGEPFVQLQGTDPGQV